jgi:predicted Zn-dependent protease
MSQVRFKIKLESGRVLGPLDLERVRLLVKKGVLKGDEVAREHPSGEWRGIAEIPELAEVFLKVAQSRIDNSRSVSIVQSSAEPDVLSPERAADPAGPTEILPEGDGLLPGADGGRTVALTEVSIPGRKKKHEKTPKHTRSKSRSKPKESDEESTVALGGENDEDKTLVTAPRVEGSVAISLDVGTEPELDPEEREAAAVARRRDAANAMVVRDEQLLPVAMQAPRSIAQEETVIFQASGLPGVNGPPGGKKKKRWEMIKATAAAFALGMVLFEVVLTEPPKTQQGRPKPVRPALPDPISGPADPKRSVEVYQKAMRVYVADNVVGYRKSADLLRTSASLDPDNARAVAMLASSYLNLIDSSNKDENYFSVISKLIDMTRAKQPDLPEAVIADVEFYLSANKPEAAQSRIVDYTKSNQQLQHELYYYLALVFFNRGSYKAAGRYLNEIADNKAFSPKVFYLRGQVMERLNDLDGALVEYDKAVKKSKNHAKSRLRIAEILYRKGKIRTQEAADQLAFLTTNSTLLAPKDLALAFYLHSQLATIFGKLDLALGDMERAVKLDKDNHDYLLELYSLRAKAGDKVPRLKDEARMYYFLSEGEKFLRQGKVKEALDEFLQARQANEGSPLPLLKIGDMFRNLNDMANARLNYKKAADRAPGNIEVWSKYIQVLIQSFEYEEALKAMDRFRKLPVPQSAIDKAAGDLYAKQQSYAEALALYKKAMARDTIDPDVYISYAKTLVAARQYSDAPFFFALALRFDPANVEALIGTAKCIAATESIDRGIRMMQDELQKQGSPRAELLAAIAELQIQKGSWDDAQKFVDEARAANPEYAFPWKLQAQIHLARKDSDKLALDKALDAYKSYSDRNNGDPSGYLERYSIYVTRVEYDKASEELSKVFAIYPRYPNLHYYKGLLYAAMLNHKTAIDELRLELRNNPKNMRAMIALCKELVDRGAPDEGLEYCNKAMVADPKSGEAKFQAGYANFMKKNYQGAIALYNAALVYDKGNAQIYRRLAQAHKAVNEPGNVQTACRRYLELEPNAPDRDDCARYE